ncbi:MAG TPA: hypothetical protein VLH79_06510 [Chthonomonadales bacterium]|nr:hypothetical protein [Chthonomonadales bacterium]
MSDTVRDLVVGFFAAALISGLASERVQRATERQLRRDLRTHDLRVRIDQAGPLGMLFGRASVVRVGGSGASLDSAPLVVRPGAGLSARVRSIRLDLRESAAGDLEVDRMQAHFSDAWVDVGALMRDRIVVRAAGEGVASIMVGEDLIARLASRRFRASRNVVARVTPDRLVVSADVELLGARSRVEVTGRLALLDGARLAVDRPSVRLNGLLLDEAASAGLVAPMNPVIDLGRDLRTSMKLRATAVHLERGQVRLEARVSLPVESCAPQGVEDGSS